MLKARWTVITRHSPRNRRKARTLALAQRLQSDPHLKEEFPKALDRYLDNAMKMLPEIAPSIRYDLDELVRKAEDLGISVPATTQRIPLDESDLKFAMLAPSAIKELSLLIRQKRRENIEWWVKVITPLLALITGLVAAATGLLSLMYKR